jgi:nitronate monooxygenase
MEELNREGTAILPYPLQRALVRNLSVAAEAAGRADLMPLWAGQSATLSIGTDAPTLLSALVDDLYDIAGPVVQWSASRRHQSAIDIFREVEG